MNTAIARNEYSFDTHLDFGCLGELPVEVFYVYHRGRPTSDPYQIPDPPYCEITWVEWEGKNIKDQLSESTIEELAIEAIAHC